MIVVTLGEIMLRLSVQTGERLMQATRIAMHYGGAEANVGVALAHLGHEVQFVSKVPDHALGEAVKRHLQAHGVKTAHLLRGGERLGTYYMEAGVGERSTQVIYDRKHSSFSGMTAAELDLEAVLAGADLFHVSGITAALSPELQNITLLALQTAKALGMQTSFDFNYRAKLWGHAEAAAAIQPFLPYTDISFCSELDAIHLLGIPQADQALPKEQRLLYYYNSIIGRYPNIRWLASTFRTVHDATHHTLQGNLYKDGLLYQSDEHYMTVVDRVGGGDAFAAGVLHGILKGNAPQCSIEFAAAASALKHTVHGDCHSFSETDIQQFAKNRSGHIVR